MARDAPSIKNRLSTNSSRIFGLQKSPEWVKITTKGFAAIPSLQENRYAQADLALVGQASIALVEIVNEIISGVRGGGSGVPLER
ncbi:MAG TPA: hypothetical protein IGS52_19305 [Oscillatoriaceae cyanobacterium M33_DOE_052]|nr:hypothetical protein [Oscillatoriaceae cyanobacterium M33_DOE_052]